MKLWDKGFSTSKIVEQFTVGKDRELDLKLATYDVAGNKAHAKMLHKIGILSDEEISGIIEVLDDIQGSINDGTFVIEETFEDVHSKIEFQLTKALGEAGKKIHTARSRNDQILVDLHLYTKAEILKIKGLVRKLFDILMNLSEENKDILLPGYTHMQIAMPSSFGLWFGGYAESLVDDIILLNAAFKISNQNPLGSAAGYGTSFPIDRGMTTRLLGFETLKYNVVAAQMSRGKLEKSLAFALSSVAGTLAKFASDICLYMNQNFKFLRFPKELTTGSSIMPHKQNPDVWELIRARCNKIQMLPTEIMMITNNLPSGYHRDFQLLKENLIEGIELLKECLEMSFFMLQHVIINDHILDNKIYDHLFSVEKVNELVKNGLSFRDAYKIVGTEILKGNSIGRPEIRHTHEGSIGNLCTTEIKNKFKHYYDLSIHDPLMCHDEL